MPAQESLFSLLKINIAHYSKEEVIFLEANLFFQVCHELNIFFETIQKSYLNLIKGNVEKEETMLTANFITYIVKDILSTEEYSLEGIAHYTHLPEDVIIDLAIGRNPDPSLVLSRKIIELHKTVRPHLYVEMIRKISTQLVSSQ